MSGNAGPTFGLGGTYCGAAGTISSTYGASLDYEGIERQFEDIDWTVTTPGPKVKLSQMYLKARLVRNASAGALTPGKIVKYTTGYYGRRVAITSAANEQCAGIVDPALPSAGVRVGDLFWMIFYGPTLVQKTTGASTDHALATKIVTNSSGVGVASGTPADATAATALALNTVGSVMLAPTTAATLMRIFANILHS
jgi:hypothetical protein